MTTGQTWVRTYREIWPFDWQTPAHFVSGLFCLVCCCCCCFCFCFVFLGNVAKTRVLRNYNFTLSSLSTVGLQRLIKEEGNINKSKQCGSLFEYSSKKQKKHICIVVWRSQVLVIAAEASVTPLRRGVLVCLQRRKVVKDAAALLSIFDERRRRK